MIWRHLHRLESLSLLILQKVLRPFLMMLYGYEYPVGRSTDTIMGLGDALTPRHLANATLAMLTALGLLSYFLLQCSNKKWSHMLGR
ncbi:hypothetical protein O6P43_017338 [Quillaja saponaria]|uniref:Uncharacterized protein n=1 Tax=Quillaja saponaria TaxID=32244 RepID=A0AAD7LPN7_QUISA|nr:hypothetical protein O6P43_017338 [Quillaja saponaria]